MWGSNLARSTSTGPLAQGPVPAGPAQLGTARRPVRMVSVLRGHISGSHVTTAGFEPVSMLQPEARSESSLFGGPRRLFNVSPNGPGRDVGLRVGLPVVTVGADDNL